MKITKNVLELKIIEKERQSNSICMLLTDHRKKKHSSAYRRAIDLPLGRSRQKKRLFTAYDDRIIVN